MHGEYRYQTLLRAAELGAEYADLDWDEASPDRIAQRFTHAASSCPHT